MRITKCLSGLMFVALFAGMGTVSAQDDAVEALLAATTKSIRGSESPDQIPFHWQMYWFLAHYSSNPQTLESSLTEADKAILSQYAKGEPIARQADYAQYVATFTSKCSESAIESTDSVDLARVVDSIAAESDERQSSRYRTMLSGLSETGRRAVYDHVAKKVVPTIGLTISDNVRVAKEAPEYFRNSVRSACKAMLEGPGISPPSDTADSPRESVRTPQPASLEESPVIRFEQ